MAWSVPRAVSKYIARSILVLIRRGETRCAVLSGRDIAPGLYHIARGRNEGKASHPQPVGVMPRAGWNGISCPRGHSSLLEADTTSGSTSADQHAQTPVFLAQWHICEQGVIRNCYRLTGGGRVSLCLPGEEKEDNLREKKKTIFTEICALSLNISAFG